MDIKSTQSSVSVYHSSLCQCVLLYSLLILKTSNFFHTLACIYWYRFIRKFCIGNSWIIIGYRIGLIMWYRYSLGCYDCNVLTARDPVNPAEDVYFSSCMVSQVPSCVAALLLRHLNLRHPCHHVFLALCSFSWSNIDITVSSKVCTGSNGSHKWEWGTVCT